MARTITCPLCSRRLTLDDLVVSSDYTARNLETCGRVVIAERARVSARAVRASEGIEVLGSLSVGDGGGETSGHLLLGPGARWAGDCRAATLVMHPGAVVSGGLLRIVPSSHADDAAGEAVPAASARGCATA